MIVLCRLSSECDGPTVELDGDLRECMACGERFVEGTTERVRRIRRAVTEGWSR